MARERLIVALDYKNLDEVKKLVETVGDEVEVYKVGLEVFLNTKGEVIDYLKKMGKKIFLDLKFHDIPNTTTMASIFAANQDVLMFNVHASGGKKMMSSIINEVKKVNDKTLAIAVTVLTSFTEEEVREQFMTTATIKELALNWAKGSMESGMDGVVCSPLEAKAIKEHCGEEFKTVCPGVRPSWASSNDQKRIMTPKEAIINKCDYLVVGRPITKADNPKEAARLILEEIEEGIKEVEDANKKS